MANTIIMSKYQGLGNDYLILDPKKNQVQLQGKKIALLCQRGFGLGADGVLYGPVEIDGKLGVRIFNADGSESAISGNGVRIFAKYLMDNGYITEKKFDIEAMSGTIHVLQTCLIIIYRVNADRDRWFCIHYHLLFLKRSVNRGLLCGSGRRIISLFAALFSRRTCGQCCRHNDTG